MKKLFLGILFLLGASAANAQISKDHVMVGGNIADLNIAFDNQTSFQLTPKAAWFIQDGLAIGGYAKFGLNHVNGTSGNNYSYGIGPYARYFPNTDKLPSLGKAKLFMEASAGFEGKDSPGSNTNGLGFGIGPGISYFITPSIGLEALLRYDGILGFGSSTYTNGLSFGIGFQVYLPSKKLIKEIKSLR